MNKKLVYTFSDLISTMKIVDYTNLYYKDGIYYFNLLQQNDVIMVDNSLSECLINNFNIYKFNSQTNQFIFNIRQYELFVRHCHRILKDLIIKFDNVNIKTKSDIIKTIDNTYIIKFEKTNVFHNGKKQNINTLIIADKRFENKNLLYFPYKNITNIKGTKLLKLFKDCYNLLLNSNNSNDIITKS